MLMPNNFSNLATNLVGKGKTLSNMIGGTKKAHVSFSLDRKKTKGGEDEMMHSGHNDVGPSSGYPSGWHAPYPDAIPAFPLVMNTKNVANPHRWSGSRLLATEIEACRETPISRKDGEPNSKLSQLKDDAADRVMRAVLRIPEDVYSKIDTVWGTIKNDDDSSNKPKTSAATAAFDAKQTKQPVPPNNATSSSEAKTAAIASSGPRHHASPYVPNFLPPFPTDHFSNMANDNLAASMATSAVMGNIVSRTHHNQEKRKSSELTAAPVGGGDDKGNNKRVVPERDVVRRSVIGLGKSVGPTYWGSEWLNDDNDDAVDNAKRSGTTTTSESTLFNAGKLEVCVAPGEGGVRGSPSSLTTKKSGQNSSQVLPLGRASGSRLSKILEGSMNVS